MENRQTLWLYLFEDSHSGTDLMGTEFIAAAGKYGFLAFGSDGFPIAIPLTDSTFTNQTWATFVLGTCSIVLRAEKCCWHAALIFSIVRSSNLKGTNSLGPNLEYFCAFPETEALNRCIVILPEEFFQIYFP